MTKTAAELQQKFKKHLLKYKLIEKGQRLLLAVSGGMDSVAMMHLFKSLGEVELGIAHIHHGLRGEEADEDMRFVQRLAEKHQIPFYCQKVDVKKFARQNKMSIEEAARILRYKALEEIAKKHNFQKVALGHTLNDQAETVLYHILRGSGLPGFAGIPRTRDFYIRPLLEITRQEIENYVTALGIQYRQDSSNLDLCIKRNRIRHELIPYIKKYFNPQIVNTLNREAQIFKEVEDFLQHYVDSLFKSLILSQKKHKIILDIQKFLSYFVILKKYILFRACQEISIDHNLLTFQKLERILNIVEQRKPGKKILIDKDSELLIDHVGLVIRKVKSYPDQKIEFEIHGDGEIIFNNFKFKWYVISRKDSVKFVLNPNIEYMDFTETSNKFCLRYFQPGDKFFPINFHGVKKISDFFTDLKVPHHLRSEIPILECPKGIVWVCGYRLDDRFKVTDKTRRILKMEMHEVSDDY